MTGEADMVAGLYGFLGVIVGMVGAAVGLLISLHRKADQIIERLENPQT